MAKWEHKKGYSTKILADDNDMQNKGVQVQLVRFKSEKGSHHHKKKTEYFYFTKDGGKLIIEGKTYKIKKGLSVVIKPNQEHSFDASKTNYIECLNVKTNHRNGDTY